MSSESTINIDITAIKTLADYRQAMLHIVAQIASGKQVKQAMAMVTALKEIRSSLITELGISAGSDQKVHVESETASWSSAQTPLKKTKVLS